MSAVQVVTVYTGYSYEHWSRQLWATGARAPPSPSTPNCLIFLVTSLSVTVLKVIGCEDRLRNDLWAILCRVGR